MTNIGNDRARLSKMALAASKAMGKSKLQAFADRGYFNGRDRRWNRVAVFLLQAAR